MARLELLGPPRFVDERGERPLPATLAACLVVRLACAEGWLPREILLPDLWPEADETTARTNLRQLLRSLRDDLADAIERSGEALRFAGPCDVRDARLLISGRAWATALGLRRGPFLDAFAPRRAPAFEDWIDRERARWDAAFRDAAEQAFASATTAGDAAAAATISERWLAIDPLDVETARAVRDGLERLGAPAAARRVVAGHVEAVRALGLPVQPDLVEERPPPHVPDPAGVGTAGRAPSLQAVLAVPPGRDADVAALDAWWAGHGRWLTIVAPGGMGKTTLADAWVQGIARHGGEFDVVDLNGVRDAGVATRRAVAALARGTWAERPGTAALEDLVGSRPHLLVVDAAEDLGDAADTLASWTVAAPGLRLLVTSRRPLGGRGERVLPLAALSIAPGPDGTPSAAARVAWASATRAVGRAPDAEDDPPEAVQRAVERLGGWPLGLTLLGGWAAWLGLDGWLTALTEDAIDLAASDASETVNASWQHLDAQHRAALASLTALPRPWALGDARAVGVPLPILADLASTGWVTGSDGAFTVHPILAAHAEAAAPDRHATALSDHAVNVLATYARAYERDGRPPAGAYERIHHLLQAWSWACDTGDVERLVAASTVTMIALSDAQRLNDMVWSAERARNVLAGPHGDRLEPSVRDRFVRGLDIVPLQVGLQVGRIDRERAARLEHDAREAGDAIALARVLAYRAILAYRDDGDLEAAMRLAEEGLSAVENARDRRSLAVAAQLANVRGLAAEAAGRSAEARPWIERAERDGIAAGGPSVGAGWGHNLAAMDHWHGRYRAALARNETILAAAEADGAPIALVERWLQRARLQVALGDVTGARTSVARGLAVSERMQPDVRRRWQEDGWRLLAEAALLENDLDGAERWLAGCRPNREGARVAAQIALERGEWAHAEHVATAPLDRITVFPPHRATCGLLARLQALRATARVGMHGPEAGADVLEALEFARARANEPDIAWCARPAVAWALASDEADLAARIGSAVAVTEACDAATRRAVARLLSLGSHPPAPTRPTIETLDHTLDALVARARDRNAPTSS